MPLSGWNEKLLGVGNGGFSGAIWYPLLAEGLVLGYAAAGSDTGHEGTPVDASFAIGHPEKLIDFGYRAVHEMTVKAKAVIDAFYERKPRHSYWTGCSNGGRQALMEAQRFPDDYDGIIAGAPANFMTHALASGVWMEDALSHIPKEKQALMHKAVLDACDSLDGLKDGMLEDPTACHYDPKALECKQSDGANCLTSAEVEAARKIYAGPVSLRTTEQVFPGREPGSELGWSFFAATPQSEPLSISYFKYLLEDAKWDFRAFNLDTDVALADRRDGAVLNAVDSNLKAFVARGGKLILYHGWSDAAIAPLSTVKYYNSVVASLGKRTAQQAIRLFMIPGQDHCAWGGWLFDVIGALQDWREHGMPPERIVASRYMDPGGRETRPLDVQISRWSPALGKMDRTRPLCPYPQIARYLGHGSTDDARNFVCRSK